MSRVWKSPTKTKQSFGDTVNINTLAARALQGQPIPMRNGVARYGEFSQHVNLQTALDAVQSAQESFMRIPAKIRERFDHDPVQFVEFMQACEEMDPAVRGEGITLGLVKATPEEIDFMRAAAAAKDAAAAAAKLPPSEE